MRPALAVAVAGAAIAAATALAVGGCDAGRGDDAVLEDDHARLTAQRTEVRDLVADLATRAASALGGRLSAAGGHWEGCASVFPEGHGSYRYRASVRIEPGPATGPPYLDDLVPVLVEARVHDRAGGERPGGHTLMGSRGETEARFSELPGLGDYVLLDVAGPCVEVSHHPARAPGRTNGPAPPARLTGIPARADRAPSACLRRSRGEQT